MTKLILSAWLLVFSHSGARAAGHADTGFLILNGVRHLEAKNSDSTGGTKLSLARRAIASPRITPPPRNQNSVPQKGGASPAARVCAEFLRGQPEAFAHPKSGDAISLCRFSDGSALATWDWIRARQ